MKNYYSVLGVLPTAELIVIKAAYRALCQMYHPDKYAGDRKKSEALLKEFNEAWDVLSDPVKRREYDVQFASGKGTFGEPEEEPESEESFLANLRALFPEFEVACEYYPDILPITADLQRVSRRLAGGFVAVLLETKAFGERKQLAAALTDKFFESYFGTNPEILLFAKKIVAIGHKRAALELNKAVNVFGANIDAQLVINRIDEKLGIAASLREQEEQKRKAAITADVKAAYRDVMRLRSGLTSDKLGQLMAASLPIRTALGISMGHEKAKSGLLSSFADDILVFQRGHDTWRVNYNVEAVAEWTYSILIPSAEREFGLIE